jgi:hypothetical protein
VAIKQRGAQPDNSMGEAVLGGRVGQGLAHHGHDEVVHVGVLLLVHAASGEVHPARGCCTPTSTTYNALPTSRASAAVRAQGDRGESKQRNRSPTVDSEHWLKQSEVPVSILYFSDRGLLAGRASRQNSATAESSEV